MTEDPDARKITVRVRAQDPKVRADAERVISEALLAGGFTDRPPRPSLRLVAGGNEQEEGAS